MVNYGQGKVYAIECNETGKRYIGSTCKKTLAERLSLHTSNFRVWKKTGKHFMTSYDVLERGNYTIVLLELFPCTMKDELHARERHYIQTTECVNKYIPLRTQKEYKADFADVIHAYQKQYKIDNIDKIKAPYKCEVCECGIQCCEISRHEKTKKHVRNLSKQQQTEPV